MLTGLLTRLAGKRENEAVRRGTLLEWMPCSDG
jgi:hypothetical protein